MLVLCTFCVGGVHGDGDEHYHTDTGCVAKMALHLCKGEKEG